MTLKQMEALRVGDQVRATAGPMNGLIGVVRDKSRPPFVRVSFMLGGRPRRIDVMGSEIELLQTALTDPQGGGLEW